MTTILACTDGSVYAPSIYDHAAWAAGRLKTGVQVLHMIEHPAQPGPNDVSGAIGFDASAELMAELVTLAETQGRLAQAKARAVLQQAQQHLPAAGVEAVSVKTQHGSLVDALPGPDAGEHLVVVGKRGEHADFAKLHLGSNLERVIRGSCQPVLVASRRFESIERFLLAYDGSPSVLKAVDFLLQSPLLRGLHCHLLRAGKIDDTARYYLEETAGKLRAAGFTVTTQATPGSAEEVIAAAVREQRSNLLVMGAYGHSRIRRLIVGSTTTATIRTVSVPVLLFR